MDLKISKVLISDEIDDQCVILLKANGIEVLKDPKLAKDVPRLLATVPEYDALIVRSATKVTAEVIEAGKNLKLIGRAGTGVDNIDRNSATARGIIVMNTPGGNTLSAAEHTCALICCLSRQIPQAHESMRQKRWDRKLFMGNELYGKTLAIVGLGRIGREVATRMQSFGMKTIGFDPLVSAEEAAEYNIEWMTTDKMWPLADYITVHVPLIPPTKHMINYETLKGGKHGVRVLNVARGGIIDEEGLLKALDEGFCAGAALDVFAEEPPQFGALHAHPKVICTPHLGASTVEAQTRVAKEIAEQMVDLLAGKALFGAVNAPALAHAFSPSSKPWVELGSTLGRLLAAVVKDLSDAQVELDLQGSGLQSAGPFLGAAVSSGLLASQGQDMNLVSAPALAKKMGIQITHKHSAAEQDALSVTVKTSAQSVCARGTASPAGGVVMSVGDATFPAGALVGAGSKAGLLVRATNPLAALQGLPVAQVSLSEATGGEVTALATLSAQPGDLNGVQTTASFMAQF